MVCVIEWLLHNKSYSGRVMMAVLIVAFGVGICTVTDVQINGKGFLCACVAVMCTSLQQIVSNNFLCYYRCFFFSFRIVPLAFGNYQSNASLQSINIPL